MYTYIYIYKGKSCHKSIVVKTRRAPCFHDYIYYAHLAFVRLKLSTLWVCRESLMATYI